MNPYALLYQGAGAIAGLIGLVLLQRVPDGAGWTIANIVLAGIAIGAGAASIAAFVAYIRDIKQTFRAARRAPPRPDHRP